jgi:hypothetical protein
MATVTQTFIAIKFADGTVGIMGFVTAEYFADGKTIRWSKDPTADNIEAEIARTAFDIGKLPHAGWRFIDPKTLPADREFRNAWVDDGRAITHDMDKARALCIERLRLARNEKLDALDKDWMRASGQKDQAEADAVEAERQVLRDFPADIAAALDAAATVEDLKAIKLPE